MDLNEEQIAQHLQHILTHEKIEFDVYATELIARAELDTFISHSAEIRIEEYWLVCF